jgi:hypothetical protein
MIGLVSDLIASNRRILADTQYHVRRAEYDAIYNQQKLEKETVRTYRVVEKEDMSQIKYQNSMVAKG